MSTDRGLINRVSHKPIARNNARSALERIEAELSTLINQRRSLSPDILSAKVCLENLIVAIKRIYGL